MSIIKIPHLEAMRIAVLNTNIKELRTRKELKQLELQQLDSKINQGRIEIQEILKRNGKDHLQIGTVLSEEDAGLEAGTLLGLDGKPLTDDT